MQSHPIATAPRDGTRILAHGTYGWGTLDNHTARGWLVVEWVDDLVWDEDGTPIHDQIVHTVHQQHGVPTPGLEHAIEIAASHLLDLVRAVRS